MVLMSDKPEIGASVETIRARYEGGYYFRGRGQTDADVASLLTEVDRLRTTLDEIQAKVHDGSLSAKQIVGTLRVKLARTAPITPSVASQR